MAKIKTSSAKNKGRKLQNKVRDLIIAEFKSLGIGDVESCSMGSGGVDIRMSPLARYIFPVSIECKNTKKAPSDAEMRQSEYNAYPDTLAAVIWSPYGKNEEEAMITFRFKNFLSWFHKIVQNS